MSVERVVHAAAIVDRGDMDDGPVICDRGAERDVGGAARLMHADGGPDEPPVRGRRGDRARAGAARLGEADAALVHLHRELAGSRAGGRRARR